MLKIDFENKESQKIILPVNSESATEEDDEDTKMMMDTSDTNKESDYDI